MNIVPKIPILGNLHEKGQIESLGFSSQDRRVAVDVTKDFEQLERSGVVELGYGINLDRIRFMLVTKDFVLEVLVTTQHSGRIKTSNRYVFTARLAPHLAWTSPDSRVRVVPYVTESIKFNSDCKNQIRIGV